ncbi:hypothetical protein M0R45_035772 [Rubus argutus]|uniref:Uncharacterized protein n=1 Tax=Rubus argutus TaxID=59490 RepID=A0AAW1VXW2_RUBAR
MEARGCSGVGDGLASWSSQRRRLRWCGLVCGLRYMEKPWWWFEFPTMDAESNGIEGGISECSVELVEGEGLIWVDEIEVAGLGSELGSYRNDVRW